MTREDQNLVQVWIPAGVAERISAHARREAGSTAALLRELIASAINATSLERFPRLLNR